MNPALFSRMGVLRAEHRRGRALLFAGLAFLALGIVSALFACQPAAAQVPAGAWEHQRYLTQVAQARFGVTAPVARLAAQVHQESAWRSEVCSWAGACGLTQFMPKTAAWMAEIYPRQLAPADPTNPRWALLAQVYYNHWLLQRIEAKNDCARWAMTLSAYNGGIGWLGRDQRLTAAAGGDSQRWFGHVARYTQRAGWAREENRGYVTRILLELEPRYASAGWPGRPVCLRQDRQCSRD